VEEIFLRVRDRGAVNEWSGVERMTLGGKWRRYF
jgi:hypothetical protein